MVLTEQKYGVKTKDYGKGDISWPNQTGGKPSKIYTKGARDFEVI